MIQTPLIKCVICGDQVIRKHHAQRTCLKEKCKEAVVKKQHKRKNCIKNCRCCGIMFTTTHIAKAYCSKECSEKIRKIRTKMAGTDWARRKNGTYDKYARILREVGYTVISPRRKL